MQPIGPLNEGGHVITNAIWFRNDLRVHDHGPLLDAVRRGGNLACIYVLDPRHFEATRELGVPRTGAHRARFLIESLADLRTRLQELGNDLVIARGRPEEVLPVLARAHGLQSIAYHARVGTEEQACEAALDRACAREGIASTRFWDATLLEPRDLPFAVENTPEVFSQFRKRVEKVGNWTAPLAAPSELPPPPPDLQPGALPTLAELGHEQPTPDERAALPFPGGERAALRRLHDYFWERDLLQNYKETRNGMVGADYSSKLSPWLAHGCLSPRHVQAEIERYEHLRVRNDSTYWLTFELLWRDYFQLILAKHGAAVFRSEGLQGIPVPWRGLEHRDDQRMFDAWRDGRTGYPIVDANMRELAATGFLSNRGRQIVGSFLTKNLGIDWRLGAEWFESQLIDHDVGANYGNWNYVAGVGNDARGFRYFNLPTQAGKYDRKGQHAKLWCPELEPFDADEVHAPWTVPSDRQRELGCVIGRDYPEPVVDLDRSAAHNRRLWEAAMQRAEAGPRSATR